MANSLAMAGRIRERIRIRGEGYCSMVARAIMLRGVSEFLNGRRNEVAFRPLQLMNRHPGHSNDCYRTFFQVLPEYR